VFTNALVMVDVIENVHVIVLPEIKWGESAGVGVGV
jgi:hypothetical protein